MSSSVELTPVQQAVFGDLSQEYPNTRRMLERVPGERLVWAPDPKSMSLGHLAMHIANLPSWVFTIIESDEFDVATLSRPSNEAETAGEILNRFDENRTRAVAALSKASDALLADPWILRRGEHVIFTRPRAAALRVMGISHMIHHRGQLSVYLRLLQVPIPGMYGPSADEPL